MDHFKAQLLALFGDKEKAQEAFNSAVELVQPVSAGGFVQAEQNVKAAFPQAEPQAYSAQVAAAVAPPQPQQAHPGPAPMGDNGRPKRWVPPGVSKKTGRPYAGFWAEDRDRF